MQQKTYKIHGAGLGLRRDSIKELLNTPTPQVGFMEVAPENWIGVGGTFGKQLRAFTESATACRCPSAARHRWMKTSSGRSVRF